MTRLASVFFSILVFYSALTEAERNTSCNLAQTPSLPKVVFVGENHRDKDSIQIRELILKDGADGKFPVASEVAKNQTDIPFTPFLRDRVVAKLEGDAVNNHLHGIESEIPDGLLSSYNEMIKL